MFKIFPSKCIHFLIRVCRRRQPQKWTVQSSVEWQLSPRFVPISIVSREFSRWAQRHINSIGITRSRIIAAEKVLQHFLFELLITIKINPIVLHKWPKFFKDLSPDHRLLGIWTNKRMGSTSYKSPRDTCSPVLADYHISIHGL